MKQREFDAILKRCTTGDRLDVEKVKALPNEDRYKAGLYIIKTRRPLLVEFAEGFDRSWLAAMGYIYRTIGVGGYTFLHTCEHHIRTVAPEPKPVDDRPWVTLTKRPIPSPPVISTRSKRTEASGIRQLDAWLIDQARAEAAARNDEYNGFQFGQLRQPLTPAERDVINLYLFGNEHGNH